MTDPVAALREELPARLPRGRTTDQVGITMDWLPTLLSAAGTTPDTRYPPDGMDLLPILAGRAPTVPRKLYWRYKVRGQRAVRDGNAAMARLERHDAAGGRGELHPRLQRSKSWPDHYGADDIDQRPDIPTPADTLEDAP